MPVKRLPTRIHPSHTLRPHLEIRFKLAPSNRRHSIERRNQTPRNRQTLRHSSHGARRRLLDRGRRSRRLLRYLSPHMPSFRISPAPLRHHRTQPQHHKPLQHIRQRPTLHTSPLPHPSSQTLRQRQSQPRSHMQHNTAQRSNMQHNAADVTQPKRQHPTKKTTPKKPTQKRADTRAPLGAPGGFR